MKCAICKNELQIRKIAKKETVTYCEYCEWKGITGPGKQLRDIIKEHNNGTVYA